MLATTRTLAALTLREMSDSSTPGRRAARLVLYAAESKELTVPETTVPNVTTSRATMPGGAGGGLFAKDGTIADAVEATPEEKVRIVTKRVAA